MGAIIGALRSIGLAIGSYFAAVGMNNAVGWTISTVVTVSFIALWVGVLNFVFSFIMGAITSPGTIFSGFPSGAVWLINQAFPLQLFFTLSVTYLIVRLSAAKLMVIAIAASRYLKGK